VNQNLNLILIGTVLLGAAILVASIVPVRRLIKQLPHGSMRKSWYILNALIVFFIAGYVSYAASLRTHEISITDTVVSLIFFFGACFVWLVNILSLKTAQDVRRISLLEHENITDSLIDIFNRRYLDRRVEEEFERANRYGLPLSILLLDIDNFKRINDSYGHQVGDTVLKNLGKLLVDTVRNTDIVARYGGEEICIIATNTQGTPAVDLAERLRLLIQSKPMAEVGEKQITITVSFGVSAMPSSIATAEELLKCADVALYRAKNEGRNRVASEMAISPLDPLPTNDSAADTLSYGTADSNV
jgi:diguanylate cyclase (GGDEF)-like protein